MNLAEAQVTIMAQDFNISEEVLISRIIALAWEKYKDTGYSELACE